MPQPDTSLITTVYTNPTHTDLYLQWDSNHNLAAKFSVIKTLTHTAKIVCSNPQLLKEEGDHLKQALRKSKYPVWALYRASIKSNRSNKANNIGNNQTTNINKPHIVVLYIKGLSKNCKNICSKHGIQMHFKGGRTIKVFIVKPKDRDTIWHKSGVIYNIQVWQSGLWGRIYWAVRQEHLQKDIMSTWKPHHPSMTIITPLVMIFPLTILETWAEKIKIRQDPLKKQFSSELMTNPLIEI